MNRPAVARTATRLLPIAPSSHGSRTLPRSDESDAPMLTLAPPPPLLFLAFFPDPGRRLISIIVRRSSGDLSHREPDGKHQERRDFVRDEAVERAVADVQVGERVRLLHRHAQPIGERVGEPWNATATATRIDRADRTGRTRRRGKERGGAFDAH